MTTSKQTSKTVSPPLPILELRRVRLQALIVQYDGPAALSRKLGIDPATGWVSQLSKGRRTISEKVAREYERRLGLQPLWFDQPLNAPLPVKPIVVNADLIERAMVAVAEEAKRLGLTLPPARFARVVAYVYDESANGREVDVAKLLRMAA